MAIRAPAGRGLILAAAAAAAVTAYLGQADDQPAVKVAALAPVERKPAEADPRAVEIAAIPERLVPRVIDIVPDDAFAVKSWAPPLPPAPPQPKVAPKPVVIAPPKPEAPALPFRYLGRLEENGEILFFLAAGDRLAPVRVGQDLLGNYRLEAASENTLTFTYLPLNITQTLSFARQQ